MQGIDGITPIFWILKLYSRCFKCKGWSLWQKHTPLVPELLTFSVSSKNQRMMGPRLEVHTVALSLHLCLLRWDLLPSFCLKSALNAAVCYALGLFPWEKVWLWLSGFSASSMGLWLDHGEAPCCCFFLILQEASL